jgi:hypothetical protein
MVALPFTLKIYLKAKEELWKLKYNFQKSSKKQPKLLQAQINLNFQHEPKYHLSKILI